VARKAKSEKRSAWSVEREGDYTLYALRSTLFSVAATAVLLAYFLPWLPHPAVGLRLIGLEMGEWVKFLPQVQSGEVAAGRNLFYLPPITLGLMLALWTAGWPNGRWQTWVMRGLAVFVSLLAFPALEAIRDEPSGEWLLRLLLIAGVALVAVLSGLGGRLPARLPWLLIFLLALPGAALPTWAYLAVRPVIADWLRAPIGIGPGVWLNLLGHLGLGLVALPRLMAPTQKDDAGHRLSRSLFN
jgi:hypothetical protein